jgi:protein phosphatase
LTVNRSRASQVDAERACVCSAVPYRIKIKGGAGAMQQLEFRFGSATEIGGRERNEDCLIEGPRLIAVADGMGGHRGGGLASQIVVEELDRLRRMPALEAGDVLGTIQRANDRIAVAARGRTGRDRMGTTITGAALVEGDDGVELLIFNVGDSRTYLHRNARWEQLTTDDSLLQDLVATGQLSAAQAAEDERRNVITRVLGFEPGTTPATSTHRPRVGDRILACSDGITDVLDPVEIATTVEGRSPSAAAAALCAATAARQGTDNATAVVADIVPTSASEGVDLEDTLRTAGIDLLATTDPAPPATGREGR